MSLSKQEKLPETAQVVLEIQLRRGFASRLLRMAGDVERIAEGDRDRVEVPRFPELAPVDGAADDGCSFLHSDHRGAGQYRPGLQLLPRSFREHAECVAAVDDLAHEPNRLAVGFTAADGDRPEGADELPDERSVVRLLLRDVVERARDLRPDRPGVGPGEVVEAEHDRTVQGNSVAAVHPERRGDARQAVE